MATQHCKKVSSNENIQAGGIKQGQEGFSLHSLCLYQEQEEGNHFSEALSRLLLTEYCLKQDHIPSPQVVTGKEA